MKNTFQCSIEFVISQVEDKSFVALDEVHITDNITKKKAFLVGKFVDIPSISKL